MLYSFDVFDTCLVRKCGTPSNLFYLLARRYYGENVSYDLLKDFVHNRKEAEKLAIEQSHKSSVTIQEIYKCMNMVFQYKNYNTIMQMEIELESEMLSPVYSIKEKIKQYREQGGSIVFISDMYLPKSFLENILSKYGLKKDQDKLFVSCEYDATKNNGQLFKIVSKILNKGKYSNWIHFGDNTFSDGVIPRKLGIKTVKIRHPYSFYENYYIKDQFFGPHKEESVLLGSILKSYRLKEKTTYARDFAIDIIASVYIPYVYWVINDAKKKGINHLLFLARDSEIFFKIAQTILGKESTIKLSYIYVSRKSLFLPSLSRITQEELMLYWESKTQESPRSLLKRLNINTEDLEGIENINIDKPLANTENLIKFIQYLTHGHNQALIRQKAQQARELFLTYLNQHKITKDENTALVDLGWSGSSRYSINKIFKEENYRPTIAYYWGFWGAASPLFSYKLGGEIRVFNHLADNQDAQLPGFVIPMLMEHYFSMTKDGSTLSYAKSQTGIVEPILGQPDNHKPHIVDLNYKTVQDLTKEISHFPNLVACLEPLFYIHGRRIWSKLITYPLKQDIKLLQDIIVSEVGTSPLICKLNFLQRLQIAFTDNVFGAAPTWKLASLYNSPLRIVYHFIYTRCPKTSMSRRINNLLLLLRNVYKQ